MEGQEADVIKMDTTTILIILAIIIAITVILTLWVNYQWREKVRRFVAGLVGYFFGVLSTLVMLLVIWLVL